MKKTIIALLIAIILVLTACGGNRYEQSDIEEDAVTVETVRIENTMDTVAVEIVEVENATPILRPPIIEASFDYLTFQEALAEFVTDIIIVQYVGHRPFGMTLVEFEFVVTDVVLGEAADRIFVYAEHVYASVMNDSWVGYRPGELQFEHGVDYLLAVRRITSPYANTHIDGFTFVRNIMVDLDNPVNSIMYSEPLYLHSQGFDFRAEGITRQQIVTHIKDVMRYNPPVVDLIRSEVLEDIVHESPNIVIIEISQLLRLTSGVSDWMCTDMYYVTVVESIKGDLDVGTVIVLSFFSDTVNLGEQHLVAMRQNARGSFFNFTARDSHFCMTQLDEIKQILGIEPPLPPTFTLTFNLHGGQPQANFPPQTVTAGTAATEPPYTPTRTGYSFTGWFTAATGGTAFDFATPIYNDTTVHAQWEAIPLTPFTLTLDPRGGTVSTSTITVPQGSPVGSLPRPVLSGREFAGWYYMPEVGNRQRILPTTVIDRDITASAVWHVTITLDPMGGIFLNCVMRGAPLLPLGDYQYLPAEIYDEFGGLHTFTAEPGTIFGSHLLTPYMTGVQFAGWFTGFGQSTVDPIIQKTEESIVPDNNMTLFARWGRGSIGSDPGRPPMGGQDFMLYDPYDALQDSEPDND